MINHPGLVQIFEFFGLPEGGAFLVMGVHCRDFASGPLRSAVTRCPKWRCCRSVYIACLRLAATHVWGNRYRDLKPGNVMLVRDPTMPTGQRVQIADPLASPSWARKNSRDDQPQTRTGLSIGTPAYMSPSSVAIPRPSPAKTDVYSLGVMMYQLLCGRLPFGSSEGALMGAHM